MSSRRGDGIGAARHAGRTSAPREARKRPPDDGRPWAVTTREWARRVACPRCGAAIGEHCRRDRGGVRQTQHWQRHDAAIASGAPVVKRFDRDRVDAGRGSSG